MGKDLSKINKICVCGHRNPSDNAFCEACGKELPSSANGVHHEICGHCGADIENDLLFCTSCGKAVAGDTHDATECPFCGALVPSELSYCNDCGKSLTGSLEASEREPVVYPSDKHWFCDFCHVKNDSEEHICTSCGRRRTEHRETFNRYLRPLNSGDLLGRPAPDIISDSNPANHKPDR